MISLDNETIAQQLRIHARMLSDRGDNLYRIRAFRQAAMAVLALSEPVVQLVARSQPIPGIGASVAETISDFARTGLWLGDRQTRPIKRTAGGAGNPVPPAVCETSVTCSA